MQFSIELQNESNICEVFDTYSLVNYIVQCNVHFTIESIHFNLHVGLHFTDHFN